MPCFCLRASFRWRTRRPRAKVKLKQSPAKVFTNTSMAELLKNRNQKTSKMGPKHAKQLKCPTNMLTLCKCWQPKVLVKSVSNMIISAMKFMPWLCHTHGPTGIEDLGKVSIWLCSQLSLERSGARVFFFVCASNPKQDCSKAHTQFLGCTSLHLDTFGFYTSLGTKQPNSLLTPMLKDSILKDLTKQASLQENLCLSSPLFSLSK